MRVFFKDKPWACLEMLLLKWRCVECVGVACDAYRTKGSPLLQELK